MPDTASDQLAKTARGAGPRSGLVIFDQQNEIFPMEELEKEIIRRAILHYRGQMSEIARRLKIGRSTLYRKMNKYGLKY